MPLPAARTEQRLWDGASQRLWDGASWVSPVPRKVRFYDLRHTHATLLRRAGVDLGFVQRALGHSSPEITAAIYDHSDIEDFREAVERALSFGAERVNAPVMQGAKNPKGEGPEAFAFARNLGAFKESGRLDLNQRPLAPQVLSLSVQGLVQVRKLLEPLAPASRPRREFRQASPVLVRILLLVCCWHSGASSAC